ncbi:MAG: type III-B CRISPR module RAMP protein Cmr4 [Candidatus Jettenia sp. CY-1]|nr:MAG: type III-B CRISPR module RAMP protein Cmr4 [Candidatus Jettenia sp. CY-1]
MYPVREIIIFHAESPLHPGSGDNVGHVDNPIQREKATGIPIVQANGVKGALREYFEDVPNKDQNKIDAIFGTDNGDDGAGAISFGEARLLFFPVRSLAGVFAYITCPSVINRFQRDLAACNKGKITVTASVDVWNPIVLKDQYLAHSQSIVDISNNNILILEEFDFKKDPSNNIDKLLEVLANSLFPNLPEYKPFKDNFARRVVILNDSDCIYFVKYSTEVEPHNRIGENGTVDKRTGVWYTEYLPAESILYAPLFIGEPKVNKVFNNPSEVNTFIKMLNGQRTWLGGDRTTGKGMVMMHFYL